MATYESFPTYAQGTLSAGTNILFTGPTGYNTSVGQLTFNSSTSNNITLVVNKLDPASSVTSFSFALAAGDVVCDNGTYMLQPGDTIEITTTAAVTNYMFSATSTAANRTYNSFI
jgi:hypothetical protein